MLDTVSDIGRYPPRERIWECPNGCTHRHRTTKGGNIQPTHPCREAGGLSVPMQEADRHGLIEPAHSIRFIAREDYSNGDRVPQRGNMAVHARRPDGSHDTVVFAPTATGRPAADRE